MPSDKNLSLAKSLYQNDNVNLLNSSSTSPENIVCEPELPYSQDNSSTNISVSKMMPASTTMFEGFDSYVSLSVCGIFWVPFF